MKRTARTPSAAVASPEGLATPLKAAGDFAELAAEWQRLFTRAWSDVSRQAQLGQAEVGDLQWPGQAWLMQTELMATQAARMTRFFEEALAAGLDLQTRWVKQFEALGLGGLQAWLPAESRMAAALPEGAFGNWFQWQRQMLSALRHDVEDAKRPG